MKHPATTKNTKEQPSWAHGPAMQQELFGSSRHACAAAMALHLAQSAAVADRARWLWVQDRTAICLTGRPFVHGLPSALRRGLVHIAAAKPEDALFALEEGLRCTDFGFVIGEMIGDPRALDFTASRRLSVASEKHGVPLYLVRHDGHADLSAARRRWRIAPFASATAPWNGRALGMPRWQADLFRARGLPPGTWIVGAADGWHPCTFPETEAAASPAPYPVDLAAESGDRSLASGRAA